MPDSHDTNHDTVRNHALWGALMAGAGGVEWYFGYRYPHNDLTLEDFRSRDLWWDQSTIATQFFKNELPFTEMQSMNQLVEGPQGFCFAKPGEVYVVYLSSATSPARISLDSGKEFMVKWFNPKNGGPLSDGSVTKVKGPGKISLGLPNGDINSDWVAIIR
jgi:hypothetical protein